MSCVRCGGTEFSSFGWNTSGSKREQCKSCKKTRTVYTQVDADRLPTPSGMEATEVNTLHGPDGQMKLQWVRSVRPKLSNSLMDSIAEAVLAKVRIPKFKRKAVGKLPANLMVGYPIGDAHIGMYSWPEETGESWNLEEATAIQQGAVSLLSQRVPKAETGLMVPLGDWFHYDGMTPMTARSKHVLDTDSRYIQMASVGMRVMLHCIEEALKKHDHLLVSCVPGNHDDVTSFWMGMTLEYIYQNDDRVTVDASRSPFRYHRFGKNFVGAYHGHHCKPTNLPAIMAADRAEDWGATEHRYWWLGHVHHQRIQEYHGCSVESFNTLAPKDHYALSGGWRARRSMKALVLDRDFGETGRYVVTSDMVKDAINGERCK